MPGTAKAGAAGKGKETPSGRAEQRRTRKREKARAPRLIAVLYVR